MICIIALVVFGILGIFSVRYRTIAKEAFDCVFRRMTFRPCTSGLDTRLKSQITGRLMKRSPRIAGQVYKHFELISWFFTILMIASLILSAQGIYFLVRYGNCNGQQGGICIFSAPQQQNPPPGCEKCAENCTCQACDSNISCICENESQQYTPRLPST